MICISWSLIFPQPQAAASLFVVRLHSTLIFCALVLFHKCTELLPKKECSSKLPCTLANKVQVTSSAEDMLRSGPARDVAAPILFPVPLPHYRHLHAVGWSIGLYGREVCWACLMVLDVKLLQDVREYVMWPSD